MTNEELNERMNRWYEVLGQWDDTLPGKYGEACCLNTLAIRECDRKARAWDELQKRVSNTWGIAPNEKEDTFAAGFSYLQGVMREVEGQFVTDTAGSSDKRDEPVLPGPAHPDQIIRELWRRVDSMRLDALSMGSDMARERAQAYSNVPIEIAKLGGWGDE